MVSAENGLALWGPPPAGLSPVLLPEPLSERVDGEEISLALRLLPSVALTRPLFCLISDAHFFAVGQFWAQPLSGATTGEALTASPNLPLCAAPSP